MASSSRLRRSQRRLKKDRPKKRKAAAAARKPRRAVAKKAVRTVAPGIVETALATPGTSLELDNRGRRLAATVVPMPFVPHRYYR